MYLNILGPDILGAPGSVPPAPWGHKPSPAAAGIGTPRMPARRRRLRRRGRPGSTPEVACCAQWPCTLIYAIEILNTKIFKAYRHSVVQGHIACLLTGPEEAQLQWRTQIQPTTAIYTLCRIGLMEQIMHCKSLRLLSVSIGCVGEPIPPT